MRETKEEIELSLGVVKRGMSESIAFWNERIVEEIKSVRKKLGVRVFVIQNISTGRAEIKLQNMNSLAER